MSSLHIRPPRFIDLFDGDINPDDVTWWVCRKCHTVRLYTTKELTDFKGRVPICAEGRGHETDGTYMQSYFMQMIGVD